MGVLIPFITIAIFAILILVVLVFFFMVGSLYVEEAIKKWFNKIFRKKQPAPPETE